ncbi:MAG: hypothetical protein KF781_07765 [Chitinophagaceae bacterium]|nr:hypothetical protein [Chitinophagaceae bacterium]MCW5905652.1 hypothetical protein [Chitinophagaceae bacterium]
MLDSYFFIPADKPKFIEKASTLKVDYLVYDLEDAVPNTNKLVAYEQLIELKLTGNEYVRIPFLDNIFSSGQLKNLINHFNERIVIPKISSTADFETIKHYFAGNKRNIILLIENSKALINLKNILEAYHPYIQAVGFGTHDFTSEIGMIHSLKNLEQFKREIIVTAHAFGISYIDSVDLNLNDSQTFIEESLFAYQNGAIGKFLIHPNQVQFLKKIPFITEDEFNKLKTVYEKFKFIDPNKIEVYRIDGEVYEKPHINRIIKLFNKLNKK